MANFQIRNPFHTKILTDLRALKHVNGSDALFASVDEIFLTLPASLPVCEVMPSPVSTSVMGLEYNEQAMGFTAVTYEIINFEAGASDADKLTEAKRKMTRIKDIEDIVLQYLQEIPDALRGTVAGADVERIDIQPSSWDYQIGEDGLRVYLSINFSIVYTIIPKQL
jgi:hypothetical protein